MPIVDPGNQLQGTFLLHNSVPEGASYGLLVDPRNQLRGTFALHSRVPEGAFVWIAAGTLINPKPLNPKLSGHTYCRPTKPAEGVVCHAQ